ncbi:MAG: MotA/TolQ/ExbB proton channel family protein [Gammaproteobacteria bacterium]|nr:MotA/TolQ/ExbB proton channel family protein [Gammaproteobacteria bacterium]
MLPNFSTDVIVNGTLYALVCFSIATWTVVLLKTLQHLRAGWSNRGYMRGFWAAPTLYAALELTNSGPAARIALAGATVLKERDTAQDLAHLGDRGDLLERHLRQQLHKERRTLESGLALLASIGSTAPFVGLFGTVWGIMHALKDITKSGAATLEVVAGPIGDALIATAIGIAVAVPAVLAYNFFLRRMKSAVADLDDFATDLHHLAAKSGFRLERDPH